MNEYIKYIYIHMISDTWTTKETKYFWVNHALDVLGNNK